MASLQRSAVSFRRQGSSGLIWEDKYFSGDLSVMKQRQEANKEFGGLRKCQSDGSTTVVKIDCSRPSGVKPIASKTIDPPPSPKPSGCWFCPFFSKPTSTPHSKPGNKKP
ncbi:MAPK kinase substrate protein [Camellia lanceoleosa]|uniref:MAPK kinase substrate protein n=2 Tax=Camellia lanceoleosa TaxID=1840588 RepID=A0ACC0FIH9_9ERIC|nr:MAPK kinase substrate protein [Camellia lanceoleosa]KAI7988144.1 MAPK kinase substrate protein [Camellia lanceoleosa]